MSPTLLRRLLSERRELLRLATYGRRFDDELGVASWLRPRYPRDYYSPVELVRRMPWLNTVEIDDHRYVIPSEPFAFGR